MEPDRFRRLLAAGDGESGKAANRFHQPAIYGIRPVWHWPFVVVVVGYGSVSRWFDATASL